MSKSKDSEILKLLEFVKKHQSFKGDVIRKPSRIHKNISTWMEADGIESGPHYCVGSHLHKLYTKWCAANNEEAASARTFHYSIRQALDYHESKNKHNIGYYINKKVKNDPKKTNKKKGQAANEEKNKKDQES